MPEYAEVDWNQAACRGSVYTDLFYLVEEKRSIANYDYINALRSVCFACPIWKQCLSYAFQHENYGVWGGLTSQERDSFKHPRKYPNQNARALEAFEEQGITYQEIRECM